MVTTSCTGVPEVSDWSTPEGMRTKVPDALSTWSLPTA
jgi:hypothetical protein